MMLEDGVRKGLFLENHREHHGTGPAPGIRIVEKRQKGASREISYDARAPEARTFRRDLLGSPVYQELESSTLATRAEAVLFNSGYFAYVLDGDVLREGDHL